MEIKITNIYSNIGDPEKNLKGSIGNAFLIEHPEGKILFDVGMRWKILLHNLKQLKKDPEGIHKIVISHGHIDHTRALKGFLKARKNSQKVIIYAHPNVRERKRMRISKIFNLWLNVSFPSLKPNLEGKIQFEYLSEFKELLPNVYYMGKIDERPHKDNYTEFMQHNFNGIWSPDNYYDDVSIVIKSKEGLIIIGSCMHAGLLNTCLHAEKHLNGKVIKVIGGIHNEGLTSDDIYDIIKILKEKFDTPKLILNHCSNTENSKIYEKELGKKIVERFSVGKEFVFSI